MFVWRKRASAAWLAANEGVLREKSGLPVRHYFGTRGEKAVAEIAASNRLSFWRDDFSTTGIKKLVIPSDSRGIPMRKLKGNFHGILRLRFAPLG